MKNPKELHGWKGANGPKRVAPRMGNVQKNRGNAGRRSGTR